MMNKNAPLYNLPDANVNALMLLFTTTKYKATESIPEIEVNSESDIDKAFLYEMIGAFWKGYSIGVADSMRVLDNESAVKCIQQAEECVAELSKEIQVLDFLDEIDEYEGRSNAETA